MSRFLVMFFVFVCGIFAQDFYTPLNILNAQRKGTRSTTGQPGENYWQNRSDYRIKVEFLPKERLIKGTVEIKYHNESPDTLTKLVIRSYPDIYKKGNLRDFQLHPEDINEGMKLDSIFYDGNYLDSHYFERYGTNLTIKGIKRIMPKESVTLKILFETRLPKISNVRMGTYDSTSFFAGYWYPQMSVYDDIEGWDINHYSGTQEFYNDFNNYDVEITTGKEFTLWASGVLQNPEDVFPEVILQRYNSVANTEEIVNIITENDLALYEELKGKGTNCWKFKAEGTPDFAFALSDHYLYDLCSYKNKSKENPIVLIGAAYKKNSEDFKSVADLARQSIKYLSEELPGYPFPYPVFHVFNGIGGMEFPMMANNGSFAKYSETIHVTIHEITHTYFPFLTGINERKYAWMDEGWAVFLPFEFEKRMAEDFYPDKTTVFSYSFMAGQESELPLMVPSTFLRGYPYRVYAYGRSAVAFLYLQGLLGKEMFGETLRGFIDTWKGKHPVPHDFFYYFNKASGKNLNWFWNPWFFESGWPDIALESFKDGQLKIIKKGNIPVPVCVTIEYKDKTQKEIIKTAGVWENSKDFLLLDIPDHENVLNIVLGNGTIADSDLSNNVLD